MPPLTRWQWRCQVRLLHRIRRDNAGVEPGGGHGAGAPRRHPAGRLQYINLLLRGQSLPILKMCPSGPIILPFTVILISVTPAAKRLEAWMFVFNPLLHARRVWRSSWCSRLPYSNMCCRWRSAARRQARLPHRCCRSRRCRRPALLTRLVIAVPASQRSTNWPWHAMQLVSAYLLADLQPSRRMLEQMTDTPS